LYAILASQHDYVGRKLFAHQKEIPIVARASTEDRFLVAAQARGHIEVGAQPFLTGESMRSNLEAAFERRQFFRRGRGKWCAEIRKDFRGRV
jgi:hypothetical protein